MPQDQGSPDTWGQKINADLAAIDAQVYANANLPVANNIEVISSATGPVSATFSFFSYQGAVGQQLRWQWAMGTTAESGSNAGSNLSLMSYSDTGTLIASPITINRATGAVAFSGLVTFAPGQLLSGNPLNIGGGSASPTIYFSSTANIGTGNVVWTEMIATSTEFTIFGPGTSGANGAQLQFLTNWQSDSGKNALMVDNIQAFLVKDITGEYAQINSSGLAFINSSGNQSYLQLVYSAPNAFMTVGGGAGFGFNGDGSAQKAGGGPWSALSSDARVKEVDGEYQPGLDAVLRLRPVVYRFKGNDGDPAKLSPHKQVAEERTPFVGLIAQEVEAVMPGMVGKREGYIDGKKVNDLRTLDTSELVYALVNAVKDLKAELDELKAR